jgi:hypothetical protein
LSGAAGQDGQRGTVQAAGGAPAGTSKTGGKGGSSAGAPTAGGASTAVGDAAGGGGGAVGRIRINNSNMPTTTGVVISPAASFGTVTAN